MKKRTAIFAGLLLVAIIAVLYIGAALFHNRKKIIKNEVVFTPAEWEQHSQMINKVIKSAQSTDSVNRVIIRMQETVINHQSKIIDAYKSAGCKDTL